MGRVGAMTLQKIKDNIKLGDLLADSLTNLNAKVSDATLDTSSATRTPSAHEGTHVSGGSDDIDSALATGAIPNLDTSKITTGQLALARLVDAVCSETEADGKVSTHAALKTLHTIYSTEAFTGNDTLTKEESGKLCTDAGAGGGGVRLTLPQDAEGGCRFTFLVVSTTAYLWVDPGAAGAIYLNGTKGTDDVSIRSQTGEAFVTVIAIGNGDWYTIGEAKNWAAG